MLTPKPTSLFPLDRRPQSGGAEVMANAVENFDAPDLTEPRQNFLLGQDRFEDFQVLFQDGGRFVEDDQEQSRFENPVFGFHFSQVVDDGIAPLSAVTAVADASFAELPGDFHFQPKTVFGDGEIGGIENRGFRGIQTQRLSAGSGSKLIRYLRAEGRLCL